MAEYYKRDCDCSNAVERRDSVRRASRASTAFFARADRCSGVIVSRHRFPPFAPIFCK